MSLTQQIKPISYLLLHTTDIVKGFATKLETIIITQNVEAKMVLSGRFPARQHCHHFLGDIQTCGKLLLIISAI